MESLINHKYGRYLLLLPIVIAVLACVYFQNAIISINDTLLAEKLTEKQLELDLICNQVDMLIARDDDWERYNYEAMLEDSITLLDGLPMTYAAIFSQDLENLGARSPSYQEAFEPFAASEYLVEAVLSNEQGHAVIPFTPAESVERDMHLYYRWVPTDQSLNNRYLVMVAISRFSITNQVAEWVTKGAIVLISTVTVFNIIMVMLIAKLGWVYQARAGDKYRKELG